MERITDERELGDIARFWEFDGAMLADWETIQSDEKNYEVSYVYVTGLMRGNAEGNFNGKATLTRMEAAVILQRFLRCGSNGRWHDKPEKNVSKVSWRRQ